MIVKDLLYQCDVEDVAGAWIKKGYDEVTPSRTYETLNELIFEEFTSLPIEEQVEYLTSAQEQTERPKIAEETPEEKNEAREQFLREKFETLQNIYFALRDYRERLIG